MGLLIENDQWSYCCLVIIFSFGDSYLQFLLFFHLFSWFYPTRHFDRQVQQFLRYVKDIYKKLPAFLPKIFEQRGQMKVHDLTEVNVEAALEETFTTTTILTEKRNTENQPISVCSRSAVGDITLLVEYLSSQLLH